jgi:hypothetical protein
MAPKDLPLRILVLRRTLGFMARKLLDQNCCIETDELERKTFNYMLSSQTRDDVRLSWVCSTAGICCPSVAMRGFAVDLP